MKLGYIKDIETYMMISGMWSSSLYFGNFVGPTLAGFLVEAKGFSRASVTYWALYVVVLIVDCVAVVYNYKKRSSKTEYQSI